MEQNKLNSNYLCVGWAALDLNILQIGLGCNPGHTDWDANCTEINVFKSHSGHCSRLEERTGTWQTCEPCVMPKLGAHISPRWKEAISPAAYMSCHLTCYKASLTQNASLSSSTIGMESGFSSCTMLFHVWSYTANRFVFQTYAIKIREWKPCWWLGRQSIRSGHLGTCNSFGEFLNPHLWRDPLVKEQGGWWRGKLPTMIMLPRDPRE